jgi:hypothetical protein
MRPRRQRTRYLLLITEALKTSNLRFYKRLKKKKVVSEKVVKYKSKLPYPSRFNDEELREKSKRQMEKFLDIFQKLHFDISFMDALVYMPKFASTFKNLISNKEKLLELAETPINAQCSAILLKKLPEKLGDLGKFSFHVL